MLGRVVAFGLMLAVGVLGGWLLPNESLSGQGVAWGLVVAAVLWFAFDYMRALRVNRWLLDHSSPAPTTWGIWGEVVDRVRLLIRLKDRQYQLSQENLEQFLAAIQASPNGVLMLDHEWRISWCNAMAAQHLGIDPLRDLAQLIGNLVRNPDFNHYLQLGDHHLPVVIDGREHRPDHPQRLSLQLFSYGLNRHLLLSQNITAIEHSEAMRRDFVANVSHEIRTPLTVLAGFVETLQTLSLTPEQQSNYLDLMARQAHRMQTLVEDLLTLSRLEGSPLPGLEPTALVTFWSSLQEEARALDEAMSSAHGGVHHIEFVCMTDAKEMLLGQKIEIQSAMSNLVANAIRYTPAGGHIKASWGFNESGDGVFSVRDTGPGIAPEHLPRITERFYRVDRSRSRETGGTGLGLAIVKHVVQRHGGELVIESTVGQGSRFAIVWPASRIKRPPDSMV
jgi:two-component system, OmpR family, phosphate regulon sensor histidine kinase PhoR